MEVPLVVATAPLPARPDAGAKSLAVQFRRWLEPRLQSGQRARERLGLSQETAAFVY